MAKENNTQQPITNTPDVYTNVAKVNFNMHEFEITFGLGSSNYEGVRPVVNMRMSPTFAKEFINVLQTNIEAFEQNFGELKLPERQ